MKKHFKLFFLATIFFLLLGGCSNLSLSNQKKDNEHTEQKWHKGVPSVYTGYYGKKSKTKDASIDPLIFQKNKVSFNKTTIKKTKYQQLSDDTYIIKGVDQNSNNYFVKMKFKNDVGIWHLGIFDSKKINHKKYNDVKKKSKNPTWYREYTKDKFDQLTKKKKKATTKDQDKANESDEDNDSSGNRNFSLVDLKDKVYMSSFHDTEFFSFMADTSSKNSTPMFSLYNVRKNGVAYQIASMKNPKFDFHGDKVTISGTQKNPSLAFYGKKNSTVTLKKIDVNILQDVKNKELYGEYDGTQNELVDRINSLKEYPVDE